MTDNTLRKFEIVYSNSQTGDTTTVVVDFSNSKRIESEFESIGYRAVAWQEKETLPPPDPNRLKSR